MIDLFEIDVNKLEQSRYKRFVSKVIDNESVFGKIIYEFIKEKAE